jgi:hypothetical protein
MLRRIGAEAMAWAIANAKLKAELVRQHAVRSGIEFAAGNATVGKSQGAAVGGEVIQKTRLPWGSRLPASTLLRALIVGSLLCAGVALADDACALFKWDVARERQLFAGSAQTLSAASGVASAPALEPGVLYELALSPQDQVHFAIAPGKKAMTAAAYGGIAELHIPSAGRYRIALDEAVWIDVVDAGNPVRSIDFAGQPGCRTPHKIVVFDLRAGNLFLQLSGSVTPKARVTLTSAMGPTP